MRAILEPTHKPFTIQIFAPNDVVSELIRFHAGEFILVIGHLARSPQGELQIVAEKVVPAYQEPEPTECTHRMSIPQVMGYL